MSENNNSLTKEQNDKAIQWVKDHWNDKSCEICGKKEWHIPPDVVTPVIYQGGFAIGQAYPQFMLICKNCGNTKYFNAVFSKVV
jgi:hypothetical protein